MPRLQTRTRLTFKVTRRYLEKINLFSQSYYQLYQKYANQSSKSQFNSNSAYVSEINIETMLLNQIEMLSLRDDERKVLEYFVNDLDSSGLLSDWKKTKQSLFKLFPDMADRKITDLLKVFQTLEPEGVGARSVSEFLIIQVKNFEMEDTDFKQLCLDVLQKENEIMGGHISAIATELDRPEEDIVDALYFIRNNLNNTLPGKLYASNKTRFTIPSAEIMVVNNLFDIQLLEDYSFVNDAEILKDLMERRSILEKILTYFFSLQNIELYNSLEFLMPVTQKQVAEELGLSYSFVNRVVNKKYIIINNKTLLLRNLFQRSINKSQQTVFFLKHLFSTPAYRDKPDIEIQKILLQQGINIARRTVNYYRNKPNVLSD